MSESNQSPMFPPDLSSGSLSVGSGSSPNEPMPDPKPMIRQLIASALELKIRSYVAFTKEIPPRDILETIKDDAMGEEEETAEGESLPKRSAAEKRAQIYSACTGALEKFAIKHSLIRQAEDIAVAIEIDDTVAETFVKAVTLDHYVDHVPLQQLYEGVMSTLWMLDDEASKDEAIAARAPASRKLATRLCNALREHQAFYGSLGRTLDRIVNALTLDVLLGDLVPSKLRIRMGKSMAKACRSQSTRVGEVIFDKDDGITIDQLGAILPIATMVEPFIYYANEIGLAKVKDANKSEAPPPPAAPPPLPKKEATPAPAALPTGPGEGDEGHDSGDPDMSITRGDDAAADGEQEVDLDDEVDALTSGG